MTALFTRSCCCQLERALRRLSFLCLLNLRCFHLFVVVVVPFYFLFFWPRWVFVALCRLSLVAASGGYSSLRCVGFSLRWLLLWWSTGSRCAGFSSYSTWAQQLRHTCFRAQAQQLWCTGLVTPRHAGSSQTRDRICVPCIGRQILNHCTTWEVHKYFRLKIIFVPIRGFQVSPIVDLVKQCVDNLENTGSELCSSSKC